MCFNQLLLELRAGTSRESRRRSKPAGKCRLTSNSFVLTHGLREPCEPSDRVTGCRRERFSPSAEMASSGGSGWVSPHHTAGEGTMKVCCISERFSGLDLLHRGESSLTIRLKRFLLSPRESPSTISIRQHVWEHTVSVSLTKPMQTMSNVSLRRHFFEVSHEC